MWVGVPFSGVICQDQGGGSYGWNVSGLDVSGLPDGSVEVTASQTDAAGNVGSSSTQSILKDTVVPVVMIASSSGINLNNKTAYTANDPNSRINKALRKWDC